MKLLLFVLTAFLPFSVFAADITGKPQVLDGNTIEMAGQVIRLFGIDAPEQKQICKADGHSWRCGEHATFALADIIGRTWVDCDKKDLDPQGRLIAVCRVGGPKGKDLGAHMVAEGMALADRKTSNNYVADEDAARAAKKGLWRGKFTKPWDWRRGVRLSSNRPRDLPCRIKGEIDQNGARIYHMPTDRTYHLTDIDRARGERWFCSETQARSAGWRRTSQ